MTEVSLVSDGIFELDLCLGLIIIADFGCFFFINFRFW